MNRRSFLQFLGLAPIAPAVLAAMPATMTFTDFGRMTPEMASATLDAVWYEEITAITRALLDAFPASSGRCASASAPANEPLRIVAASQENFDEPDRIPLHCGPDRRVTA